MKQTAVEFLIEEMQKKIPTFYAQYVMNMDEVYEQAKEMEKQQIIDAAERWKGTDFAEKYYAETYESKGSDELSKVAENTSFDTYSQTEISDEKPMRFHCVPKEISDEEIEELTIKKFYELQKKRRTLHHWSWVNGMKMYREQLKQK